AVFEASDYVAQSSIRAPALLRELIDQGLLERTYAEGEMDQRLRQALAEVDSEPQLQSQLRRFRRSEMLRIIWRDLAGTAPLAETLEDLSALADACIEQALHRLYPLLCAQFGTPMGEHSGQPQQLVVLGMGKLGARELNLSSDIDLIFAFEENGQTDGRRPLANEQFFTRLCQKLVQALGNRTFDGFVFRTDTRLRPFGDSGPLACSFDFMEDYYQSQAREWERYAMIKARVVAGDSAAGERLSAMLRPFVYRRYLDFGAIESIRDMKRLIAKEMHKKGMDANIKLGRGGIREIEFIGQAFQLIRGGRDTALQIRPILQVLAHLGERDLLPPKAVSDLTQAYEFLRRVENRVQAWRDEQTHLLPQEDELAQLRLARSMGFADWASFHQELERQRRRVQGHFDQVFAAPQADEEAADAPLLLLWKGALDEDQALQALTEAGYRQPADSLALLVRLRESSPIRSQGVRGQARMAQLMPLLLEAVGQSPRADEVLGRLLPLLEAVARRTAYLALLVESPMALSQLVRLAGDSLWIINRLTQQPLLLDELLDPRRLYSPLHRRDLEQELINLLEPVKDDMEQQMDRMRQFAQSNMLRVAAADVTGAIPLMVVSDYLTDIASVVLAQVVEQAWNDLTPRHGQPRLAAGDSGFAVIGYGKLGGIELGYGSDLDLVFLHGSEDHNAQTDGERPIPNDVFYVRLGQKMMHRLTTRTPAGQLYEVDMRLRPNGNSGLLVSGIHSFEAYQKQDAWTWEHQALVRARAIAGDPLLIARFEQVRRDVLCQPRDPEKLRLEVLDMREKMRASLDKSQAEGFDIKQGRGGITDIEFMVQYAVLRWAHEYPDLADWSDNIRLLETLQRHNLLQGLAGQHLTGIYKVLRAVYHRQSLQEQPGLVPRTKLEEERRMVEEIWQQMMLPASSL
ncbi:MAG: bifunctional [glutamate--ammonia ligase]-adenylyl-L-tyrosine phosphorylase/[glutamate--ammonia-ligase] adenylyltransferase, partial [Gammaproteobacteria bacterium]|nr:bifunctional [glutamate--ammonia ligase]-adenylyl-L-tyrosine phosphorylase/[glutamate--ammonia-ligase] adenylyltransferase [Gammaproteobacteria bacterium]